MEEVGDALPSPPCTALAATAGESADTAHASTRPLFIVLYGPASVKIHKLED